MEEEIFELEEHFQEQDFSYTGESIEEWQDIYADLPDEGVDSYPTKPSPPDDITAYNAVIKRAATT